MRRVSRAGAAQRVAAQRHDVAHAGVVIIAHDGVDFLARRGDAGEMRGRRQRRLVEDALDGGVRALARRAAGAVGHRDEIRRQRRQPLDRLPQRLAPSPPCWAGRIRTTRRCGCSATTSGWREADACITPPRACSASPRSARAYRAPATATPRSCPSEPGSGGRLLCITGSSPAAAIHCVITSPAQSRDGDAHAARAGIRARAARNRRPADGRPAATRARLRFTARAPSSRKCST